MGFSQGPQCRTISESLHIHKIQDKHGSLAEGNQEISQYAIDYYSNLFSDLDKVNNMYIFRWCEPSITERLS